MMAAMVVAIEVATLGTFVHGVAPALPDRLPESLLLVALFLASFVLHFRRAPHDAAARHTRLLPQLPARRFTAEPGPVGGGSALCAGAPARARSLCLCAAGRRSAGPEADRDPAGRRPRTPATWTASTTPSAATGRAARAHAPTWAPAAPAASSARCAPSTALSATGARARRGPRTGAARVSKARRAPTAARAQVRGALRPPLPRCAPPAPRRPALLAPSMLHAPGRRARGGAGVPALNARAAWPVVLNCVGARNNRTFVALVACIFVGQVLILRLAAAYLRRLLAARLGVPAAQARLGIVALGLAARQGAGPRRAPARAAARAAERAARAQVRWTLGGAWTAAAMAPGVGLLALVQVGPPPPCGAPCMPSRAPGPVC